MNIVRLTLYMLMLLLLHACVINRHAYAPAIQHIPALQHEKDISITAAAGTVGFTDEFAASLQVAYAVSSKLAVMGAANSTGGVVNINARTSPGGDIINEQLLYSRPLYELGIGFLQPISADRRAIFQLYGGYGWGINKIREEEDNERVLNFHNSRTNRFFLMPVFTVHPSERFTISSSFRFTNMAFTRISTSYSDSLLQVYNLQQLGNSRITLFEPAITISAGLKKAPEFRFFAQAAVSHMIPEPDFRYRRTVLSAGLQIHPHKWRKKKSS